MRSTRPALALGAALLLAPAAGEAQQAAGWQALIGCWEPAAGPGPTAVCVLPAGPSAVEMVTVAEGRVASRDRIDASGAPQPGTRESCTGWDRGRWSADGRRLYLASEHACEGGVQLRATGVMAMPSSHEWLDVRGVRVAGGPPEVRVRRFRELSASATLPAELAREVAALSERSTVRAALRANAAAPLGTAEVIDASRELDADVLEAWLVENGDGFAIDARRLAAMADAGVPGRVIDVVVALTYPRRFAIDRPAAGAGDVSARPEVADTARGAGLQARDPRVCRDYSALTRRCYDDVPPGYSPYGGGYGGYGYSPYGYSTLGYSPYGWGSGIGGWGHGYGYDRPPVIVVRGPDGSRGRVVKGRGYTRGAGAGTEESPTTEARPRSTRTTDGDRTTARPSDRGGSTRSSTPKESTKKSTESERTGRTAKPRNP